MAAETLDQPVELLLADIRRRAAAEVGEPKLAPLKGRAAAVDLVIFNQGIEINFDLRGILVRVHFEIAELAPFPTKRDVDIKSEWIVYAWRLVKRCQCLSYRICVPLRKRRIV